MQHALVLVAVAELRHFNKQVRLKMLTSGYFLISLDLLNIEPNLEKNYLCILKALKTGTQQ